MPYKEIGRAFMKRFYIITVLLFTCAALLLSSCAAGKKSPDQEAPDFSENAAVNTEYREDEPEYDMGNESESSQEHEPEPGYGQDEGMASISVELPEGWTKSEGSPFQVDYIKENCSFFINDNWNIDASKLDDEVNI